MLLEKKAFGKQLLSIKLCFYSLRYLFCFIVLVSDVVVASFFITSYFTFKWVISPFLSVCVCTPVCVRMCVRKVMVLLNVIFPRRA